MAGVSAHYCPESRANANGMDAPSTGIKVPKWKCYN